MGTIMIGSFSLGTVITFVAIVCILLLPVAKIFSMIRKKKLERRMTSDATVIDLASREAAEEDMLSEEAPAETTQADVPADDRQAGRRSRRKHPEMEYFAAFRLQDGERLEIELPEGLYKRLSIGDTGFLTYTDTEFVSFRRVMGEGPSHLKMKLEKLKKAGKSAKNKGTAETEESPVSAAIPPDAASQTAQEDIGAESPAADGEKTVVSV